MAAIYGPQGVKAGHTAGECVTQLQSAMASLVARGAEILVLGCTELPLIMQQNAAYPIAGKTVVVIDPTEILARKCVSLALADAAR
jgi:aspartate racemase